MKRIALYPLIFFVTILMFSCTNNDESITLDEILEEEITDDEDDIYLTSQITITPLPCSNQFCSIFQLVFTSDSEGYAITGVDGYKTDNSGLSWEHFINQDIVGRLIPIQDLLYLNTYDGILRSFNAGENWENIERPLEFICNSGSINPGIIHFINDTDGFVLDRCERNLLYKTLDAGTTWELIYNQPEAIQEYHYVTVNEGFVLVNDVILFTEDGGLNWEERSLLPAGFDYVIKKDNQFIFPEGITSIDIPFSSNTEVVLKFNKNSHNDIAVIFYDDAQTENKWNLYLYEQEKSEWTLIDKLENLPPDDNILGGYTDISLTDEKSIYISRWNTGEITKYYKN